MVDFMLDAVEVHMQINIAHLSNVIMVALGGKFWSTNYFRHKDRMRDNETKIVEDKVVETDKSIVGGDVAVICRGQH